jgi:hypothetical protein
MPEDGMNGLAIWREFWAARRRYKHLRSNIIHNRLPIELPHVLDPECLRRPAPPEVEREQLAEAIAAFREAVAETTNALRSSETGR